MSVVALHPHSVNNPAVTDAMTSPLSNRLASLDIFRGLTIFCMLLVNNIGDPNSVGYFWKHADWRPMPLAAQVSIWHAGFGKHLWTSISHFPLFLSCTLADFVMPMFMLMIGITIPFSVAAAKRKGNVGAVYWINVFRRGMTIYALGWCIELSLQFLNWRFSPDPHARLTFVLGMDVLQLLGTSFILARLLYCMPRPIRLSIAGFLWLEHWALLKFYPQGIVHAGTFTEAHNAIGFIYSSWPIFHSLALCFWLKFNIVGMLSVPPAAATILFGTWIGDTLASRHIQPETKIRTLFFGGTLMMLAGLAWSLDLPMNKPRWTPCYLVYCAGVGCVLILLIYWLVDVQQIRRPFQPFTVLGVNAIGIYFLSIMGKIWLLNMPRMPASDGAAQSLTHSIITMLQRLTTPALGSWLFTIAFVGIVWSVAALAYSRRLVWKV